MGPIYNSTSIIASANTPAIRLFRIPIATSPNPLPATTPIDTQWELASPKTVVQFSAICYLTAREISSRIMCEVPWVSVRVRVRVRVGGLGG